MPYVEKIVKDNIKVQKVELLTESSSKDSQTMTTQLAINYKVNKYSAVNFYKTIGSNYEQIILVSSYSRVY